jgi:uncharacterized protein (TIGR02246 family)
VATEAQAIRDLDAALSEAAQNGDAEAFSQFFAEHAVQMPPDSPPLQGRAAIFESAAGLLGAGADLRFETTEVRVATSGDDSGRGQLLGGMGEGRRRVEDHGGYVQH